MTVGEIVKVTNGEHLPADLISLSSRLEPLSRTGYVYVDPHPTPENSLHPKMVKFCVSSFKTQNFFIFLGEGHFTDVLKAFYKYSVGLCSSLKWADSAPIVINRSP